MHLKTIIKDFSVLSTPRVLCAFLEEETPLLSPGENIHIYSAQRSTSVP